MACTIFMAACVEESRNGQLTLSGSAPVRIASQDGKTVEFYSGPLKVEFGADSGRTFTVKLEQDGRTAKFSGKVPDAGSWNFTLRGKDIGQSLDFTSRRVIQLYGPISTSLGTGDRCSLNGFKDFNGSNTGEWQTEDQWQNGNEDWSVTFADTNSAAAVGDFKSRREGQSYLIAFRNIWCSFRSDHRGRRRGGPRGDQWNRMHKALEDIKPAGIKFD
jgi:hypothetical protein